jgi:hypothetical protein
MWFERGSSAPDMRIFELRLDSVAHVVRLVELSKPLHHDLFK